MKKVFTIFIYIFAAVGLFFTLGFFAVYFGLTNSSGIIDKQRENFLNNGGPTSIKPSDDTQEYWSTLPEWTTLRESIKKDQAVINRAALTAGVPARLIVSQLVAEQMRFYFDDRESFKKFFEPLKILGSQTKFSWGVMGIKEETAIQIENNLKTTTSLYYLGTQYERILDFTTEDIKNERFTRMTDQYAHYYSYLYAGLYLKQVITQWKSAGFDISKKPEILSTLYNIGFANSKPNANPQSGGAPIPIGDRVYSFGQIAGEFYNSNELVDEFPK